MKTLIRELSRDYRSCTLRYLLFEECDNFSDKVYYSILIEFRSKKGNDFKTLQNFTSSRKVAERILNKLCAGKVTPLGLPYIIEDYVTSQYLINI